MLQVCRFEMHAAGTPSSVKDCTISAVAAAHGHVEGAAQRLSWKNVRQGRACLLTIRNSPRSQFVEKATRADCVPPCAHPSSSSSTFEGVVRDENGAGAPASSSVIQSTLLHLRNAGIIACLRTNSAGVALDAARAALDGGLAVVEVTMTTPSAPKVIESLVRDYPSATIGAGTVLSMHEAEMAKQAGAKFLTSPVTVEVFVEVSLFRPIKARATAHSTQLRSNPFMNQEMVRAHRDGPVLFVPGAMTPTEVVSAYDMGSYAVKLFPVALVGDIRFVLALRKTLGHIPLIPSNGIPLDMIESYLSAGVMAVIISDAVFEKSALENRDFSRIRTLASSAASKRRLCRISPR